MPPAFVLSQDQTLRLTRTIQQPSSHPATRQSKPTKILTKRAFVRQSTIPDVRPRLSPKTPLPIPRKAQPRTRKTRQQALTRCRRPRIPSYITNNVKKRHDTRPGRSGLDARPDRVEERAYTPAVRGLSIQLMTLFRRPSKPRNIRVFRLPDRLVGWHETKIDRRRRRGH
jgi:hypothetical protein